MTKTITKFCLHCNNAFQAHLKEIKRGNGKYCSKKCCTDSNKGKTRYEKFPNTTCATCQANFYRTPSKQKNSKSGFQFCSRICKEQAQRLNGENRIPEIMPDHYGHAQPHSKMYRAIAFSVKPAKCEGCGYDRYSSVLEVHHKDKDRTNNSIDNLAILCPTCHREHHYLDESGFFGSGGSSGKEKAA